MPLKIDTRGRSGEPDARPTCFVVSPIGEAGTDVRTAADQTLKHLIRKALDADFRVDRGDADSNPGNITPRIIGAIQEADLVVADLSGLNANVFYELAIAHGYDIPTVLIQRETEKIPFDVKDMRTVRYDLSDPDKLEASQSTLRSYAVYALENKGKMETPLSQAKRFEAVAQSEDPVTESNVQVLEALQDLSSDIRKVLRRTPTLAQPFIGAPSATPDSPSDSAILREALSRIGRRGGLALADLSSTISQQTSKEHDDFIHELARMAHDNDGIDGDDLNTVLMTAALLTQLDPDQFNF